ncbi:MAG: hypothetical protein A2408_01060 [Candidatus Yonathbacteria bacterium RIFOXYC1_FULL_52_10]|uniref:AAA+ ATPase domain-containing protein n=1 Tax=Candidatus Yonathbacteria bacterium RIFOXYD1_FULL_52_36 TaxID=1802730 RepID=A0A1G2SMR9_9BACT|nr:MAG: hypothetical protein A2408_01060 [Candidatus Yonathbacteria bacterium RIFOXYC1_FULL_52_10]OHA86380.1 MAG: hypothetical protein A2591_02685 [Candidatus Yonathbacteria bacterium RIFOXYD1_FULL_52_36]
MNQAQALDILKAGRNVYLTGAAGSGKTHALNAYIAYLKHRNVGVGVTASTGIAATHVGGITIHSWSGIGIKETLTPYEIDYLTQKEHLAKRFSKTKVLVIDEISMLSPKMFDTVDQVCRAMKRNEQPFGGMQIVLSGDFFQLPPISRDGGSIRFVNASRAWNEMDVRVCYLDEQFRQSDSELEGILNEMRSGGVSPATRSILDRHQNHTLPSGVVPTRLYTHNVDVDSENDANLATLSGSAMEFEMKTKGKGNLVEALKKGILAPETLRLKEGAIVMFVKNNFDAGYVNGTLGVVEDLSGEAPIVRTVSGDRIPVLPATWVIEENDKILAQAEQLPLRLAWAITVHKSQGMSMDAAEIDLSKAFVPGQGYVALSRLRTLAGLVLRGINEMAFAAHPEVAALDAHLRRESKKWGQVIARFDAAEMRKMHDEFILRSGGTIDADEIAKNAKRAPEKKSPVERVATHEKTRVLVVEGLSLMEIAEDRGMTAGTIIAHLEKLKELDPKINLKQFKPSAADLKKIRQAFLKSKEGKLTPVYQALGGVYSFDELRLARLFL